MEEKRSSEDFSSSLVFSLIWEYSCCSIDSFCFPEVKDAHVPSLLLLFVEQAIVKGI